MMKNRNKKYKMVVMQPGAFPLIHLESSHVPIGFIVMPHCGTDIFPQANHLKNPKTSLPLTPPPPILPCTTPFSSAMIR